MGIRNTNKITHEPLAREARAHEPLEPLAREAGGLLNSIEEQLSFDLVNVNTLEAQVKKLEKQLGIAERTVDNYKGHYNKSEERVKELQMLLRRVDTTNMENDLLHDFLMRGV